MTSRTPMGAQQRPPQRTLSSSSLSTPRPPTQQRSISQQHVPSSPVRRDLGDQASDTSDAPPGRHGIGTPRLPASRLRLELSNEGASHLPITIDSPQSVTSARALTVGGDGTIDGANSPALSRVSHQENNSHNPPIPMPRRPKYQSLQRPVRHKEPPPPPSASAKKDGRPKPYTVEIPTIAPRLPATKRGEPSNADSFGKNLFSGFADFFPWSGNHFEDEWSTESITKGTWEKPSSTESSPARLALLPAIKQKNGLNALSTIYMGVLNQRRQRGQITAPSTFKPPPRVTLTDTKREVWLRDLANPATSLRRLSRTIPHGVRGRVLLDQCLNKRVPTERAVWLAKCVGANEIRAFKRKGVNGAAVMGGEAKWSRDWTGFVEQFIDAVTSAVSDAEWKSKVTYAIRLASHLYWEQLLDREHYLEWMTAGLENSTTGRLPMWILIARIYWQDLLRSRKHGKRLVYALLLHLKSLHDDPDRDVFAQLFIQLSSIVRALIQSHPENFVCPGDWPKYREALKHILPVEDTAAQRAYTDINSRNSFLAATGSAYPPAGKQQLVRLLDSTFRKSWEPNLANLCWEMSEDKSIITRTLVEWATSAYRPGLAKIYVVAGLLRSWTSMARFDATPSVLEVIDRVDTHDVERKNHAYLLISELVRNGSFSIPYYLQWLIARGGFRDASDVDPDDGPCATRLLIEIPIYCFSRRWRNERSNLLRVGGYSTESEEIDSANAIKCVDHTLGLPLPANDPMLQRKPLSLGKLLVRVQKSSRACKASIGAHLRDVMARQVSNEGSRPTILALFMSARAILETAEDFMMLSDTIRACLKVPEPSILAACADTINVHLAIFLGIGSAVEMFQTLVERLRVIVQQGVAARPLLASISHLANRLPNQEDVAAQLCQQLLECDRSSAIDACSPVSDNMITQSQGREGEISDEIDKLLASGNSIDHPTMNRLFRTLVPRLEAGWAKLDETRRVYASLLTKMRVFDPLHFDKLMADWLSHVSSMESRPKLADLYPLLVTAGCLSVVSLLQAANVSPAVVSKNAKASSGQPPPTYFQELLELLIAKIPKSDTLTVEEQYQFAVHQQSAQHGDPKSFLLLVRNAIVEYVSVPESANKSSLPLGNSIFREKLTDCLRYLVTVDSAAVSEVLAVNSLPDGCGEFMSAMSTRLLLPDCGEDTHTSFDQILGIANELTLPFCQLKLNLDLSMNQVRSAENDESAEGDDPTTSRFELFATAMDRAIEANNIVWTSMLPCLSSDISQRLKNLAFSRFLGLVPSLKSDLSIEETTDDRIHTAENLVGVIEAITAGQPSPKTSQLTTLVVEKLIDLGEIIAAREHRELQQTVLDHWLPALLRLVTLQGLASDTTATAGPPSGLAPGGKLSVVTVNCEARARAFLALCNLLLILQSLPPEMSGALSHQVFDVAIVIIDALPDELRHQCSRSILLLPGLMAGPNTSSDPRLYYLLSTPQPALTDNLVLAHKDKPGTLHGSGGRGMGAMYGIGPSASHRLSPFFMRRWEMLNESTPNVGENDTSLSLGLFEAIKIEWE